MLRWKVVKKVKIVDDIKNFYFCIFLIAHLLYRS